MSDERKLTLSLAQILAGALAAASAAVASSWLGVAGTVIGAALMSVVASVASVLYTHPIERGSDRLKAAMPPLRPVSSIPAGSTRTSSLPAAASLHRELREDVPPEAPESSPPPANDEDRLQAPATGTVARAARRISWRTVAGSAIAMLVIGLALVSGGELISGKSLSGSGADRSDAPTLVRLVRGDERPDAGQEEPAKDDTSQTESNDPQPAESGSTDGESGSTQSTPTETGPSETEPTDAEPTQPESSETETTESAPSGSPPTGPAPAEPTLPAE